LGEDRSLELAQALAWLDAKLIDELAPGVLVGLQRVGLPVAAIQREHQLGAQPFPVGLLGDQRLERSHNLGLETQGELRLDELLERSDSQVLQASDLGLREVLAGELSQRRTAPHRQHRLQHRDSALGSPCAQLVAAFGYKLFKAASVDAVAVRSELIAALAGHHRAGRTVLWRSVERLAQTRDVYLQSLGRGRWRELTPQLVYQAICAQRLVGVQHQQREQRSLLRARERDSTVPLENL
jgi:hypothetical protein